MLVNTKSVSLGGKCKERSRFLRSELKDDLDGLDSLFIPFLMRGSEGNPTYRTARRQQMCVRTSCQIEEEVTVR